MFLRQTRTFATRASRASRPVPIPKPTRTTPSSGEDARLDAKITHLLEPISVPPSPKSIDDKIQLRALMVRYGKLKRRQHLEQETKHNLFHWSRWAALDALPNTRRVEALANDPTPAPKNLPLWTDTPPIPGFNSGAMTKPT